MNDNDNVMADETDGLYFGDYSSFDLDDLGGTIKAKPKPANNSPIIIQTPTARRIIVTHKVTMHVGNFSSMSAEAMAIVDMPPDTNTAQATKTAGQVWQDLHQEYADQFRAVLSEPRDNWEAIDKLPKPMQMAITIFKTIFGNFNKSNK